MRCPTAGAYAWSYAPRHAPGQRRRSCSAPRCNRWSRDSRTVSWSCCSDKRSVSAASRCSWPTPRLAGRRDRRCASWGSSSASAPSWRWIASTSRCSAGRFSDCSGPTAPARRRLSGCCAGCSRPAAASCTWPARMCAPHQPLHARGSGTWRRNSRSTGRLPYWRTLSSSPAPTGCGARGGARVSAGRSSSSSSAIACTVSARSCRAAINSAWRWRRHCCTSRRFCFWMSPPAVPIRLRGVRSGAGSRRWPSRESR